MCWKIGVSLILIFLIGCQGVQSDRTIDWKPIGCGQLRELVNEKTGPYRIWHYSGSDQRSHYFYSETLKYFRGGREFYKMPKSEDCSVENLVESPIGNGFSHIDYVFSVPRESGEGYVHSFDFGVTTKKVQTLPLPELEAKD